ncbi:MAG: sulfotransferase [Panacagrimonas sp.]
MSAPPAPVFLLAAPFCGVSSLAGQLGCHPQLVALPELNLFMADRVIELLEIEELAQGAQMDGLLRAIAQIEFGRQNDRTITAARHWLYERRDRATGDLIHHFAGRVAPERLVIADTGSAMRPMDLRRLHRQVPDAHVLHVTRHPWTQGCLLAAWARDRLFVPPDYKDHGFQPAITDPQIPWLRANTNVEALTQALPPGRRWRVQLEQIDNAFDEHIAALCNWLGVDAGVAALKAMRSPRRWAFWGFGPGTAPYGLEPEVLETLPRDDVRGSALASLSEPLPWRPDGLGFADATITLARSYGYP